ncbi:unnamed protein product [Schistocephalus solidus]|uniref:Uncharacterized protein n=1 Tax=Schistocephalus solidus TaxID=70667 RepID=A0A183T257_SCHSO|nr:unnamed protein product [Schistocephalus solidus]
MTQDLIGRWKVWMPVDTVGIWIPCLKRRTFCTKVTQGRKDLILVPVDKRRSKVILNRTDHAQRAKGLLKDRQSHVPSATNPVKTLVREINATLWTLENSGALSPVDQRIARAQDTALARFYVHKEGVPFQSIVSLKGTPTYGLANLLFRRLKFLTANSDTTVSSSTQFFEKLKGLSLLPSDVAISFDVTSLSTPQELAVETTELLLRRTATDTPKSFNF